ncbi:hypothetical protein HanPSC8_Chr03g0133201 [Helianthus annuus]|nr:hypothetical protein HanPSC8_Chr03g0133201 [Helianthus annuus]
MTSPLNTLKLKQVKLTGNKTSPVCSLTFPSPILSRVVTAKRYPRSLVAFLAEKSSNTRTRIAFCNINPLMSRFSAGMTTFQFNCTLRNIFSALPHLYVGCTGSSGIDGVRCVVVVAYSRFGGVYRRLTGMSVF